MPYLNWKEDAELKITKEPHAEHQNQLEATLPQARMNELADDLERAFTAGAPELKVDLPGQLTIYFKTKTGLSRMQLAHPQQGVWVASVHLTVDHGAKLIAAMRDQNLPAITVSKMGSMGAINNLEVVLVRG